MQRAVRRKIGFLYLGTRRLLLVRTDEAKLIAHFLGGDISLGPYHRIDTAD